MESGEVQQQPVPTPPAKGEVRLAVGVDAEKAQVAIVFEVPERSLQVRLFYSDGEAAEFAMAITRAALEARKLARSRSIVPFPRVVTP